MRILLIAENWPPRVGGIENYLTNIARGLPSKSVAVVVPHGSDDVIGSGIQQIIKRRFFSGIIRPRWLPLLLSLRKLAKKERFDAVLCGKALFEGLIGYYLKKKFAIPYVVFTYAMEIEVWAQDSWQKRKLKKVLQNADRVVYINDVTKQSLLALGVTEKQLVKVWPGVGDRYFAEIDAKTRDAVLQKYNLKKPYIIALSRLIERKGVDLLLEAFSKLDQIKFSDVQLVIVGDGPQRRTLEDLSRRLFINTSVTFLGQVPDDDLPALYINADFFVLPPREVQGDIEGFGIVYLEANAAGLPVIGTRTGGVSEAVIDQQTGLLVSPESVNDLHRAMVFLLTHPDERQKMGAAGRQRAWNEFRWSKRILLVKGMLDALAAEKVLGKKRSQ